MGQFTIHRNKNPKSTANIPYLLDIQSDLLSELNTRIVIPLYLKECQGIEPLTKLTPEFQIEGKQYLLMTPQMAGISTKDLGEASGDLAERRTDIISAIDLLISGF